MFDGLFGRREARRQHRQLVAPRISNIVEGQTVTSSDRQGMMEIFGSVPTAAGAAVTDKSAMRVSVVYACVQRIAGAIAGLPLPVYERLGQERELVQHDVWWLLNERPCAGWSAATFWEFIAAQVLLRGDAYAYIVRNRAGAVTSLIPWPHSQVMVERQKVEDPRTPARLRYYFTHEGKYFGADQDDVLHFPGFGFNGISSMTAIQWGARNGIGIAIRADEYAGRFFATGGQPAIAIKAPGEYTPTQQQAFREAWIDRFGGAPGIDRIPFFLTEGLDVKELSMTAADGQVLESRQWQVIDVCRAFGIPPFMVGEMGKATYNNTENLGVDFVKYCLSPHLNRFEQEINIKVFRGPKNFTEYNVDGLMRGDSKAQAEYFKAALGGTQNPGWMTVNEVRKTKNMPPVEGGDVLHMPAPSDDAAPPPEDPPPTADPDTKEEDVDEPESAAA